VDSTKADSASGSSVVCARRCCLIFLLSLASPNFASCWFPSNTDMSHTTISENEGVTGQTSPFLRNNLVQTRTEEENMVYKYRKMLETLDERRKKRNEERERKRLEDPSGEVSDDEPDDITPFLEHPDKDNNTQAYGQCSQATPVPNEPTMAQPKGEARNTHTKATPKFNVEGTLFHDAEASQNKFETYDTSIPNDVTLLAACDIAPPLPLFTTEALERICDCQSGNRAIRKYSCSGYLRFSCR
jgi:hypothetical protein